MNHLCEIPIRNSFLEVTKTHETAPAVLSIKEWRALLNRKDCIVSLEIKTNTGQNFVLQLSEDAFKTAIASLNIYELDAFGIGQRVLG